MREVGGRWSGMAGYGFLRDVAMGSEVFQDLTWKSLAFWGEEPKQFLIGTAVVIVTPEEWYDNRATTTGHQGLFTRTDTVAILFCLIYSYSCPSILLHLVPLEYDDDMDEPNDG